MTTSKSNESNKLILDVALQGGGAHGAFTWGVLDALLEEERLEIGALSGASAGAMNAIVVASGIATGGREGGRAALRRFWTSVNAAAREATPVFQMLETFPGLFAASAAWWQMVSGGQVTVSSRPWQGRAAQMALRELIAEQVDFDALKREGAPQLFVSATNARSGGARIFRNDEISPDVAIASACLPMSFPPVTIDGVDYWDGGYAANPPIAALVRFTPQADLLLVTINPARRTFTARSPEEITERVSEMVFNQALLTELRGIAIIQDALIEHMKSHEGDSSSDLLRDLHELRFHEIHDEASLSVLDPHTKMYPALDMLLELHETGRAAATGWLKENFQHLGKRGTAKLRERYLNEMLQT
ncbi:patatin-like phospholipase family protein [Yangia mangrovi]|uniref:Patatin n=1 Tax=Alloyangia mangrovi TaxID=1779329 RepID=A0A2A3JYR9_9RHOB|nr:patatin-like phospholipase family protein [Alloyangia mangrovi]MCA0943078.1 patatin-like phospholipase family protein [Alloyangia pacifica]MCA0948280.1 patatin-like phospholipase family protein [Alloyangia pacifica]MCT4372620.1 patatin-like phospholipase family protein [Alloyangia mangrovi]